MLVASAYYLPSHRPCSPFELSKVKFRCPGPCYRRFVSDESSTSGDSNIDIPDGAEAADTTKVLSLASKGLSILNIVHKNVVKKDEPKKTQQFIPWRAKSTRSSAAWTRTHAMRRLSDWAFEVCDVEGTGRIDKRAFYTGMLLVHLNLAKYAGVAACSPMNRTQVDELFELADQDRTGLLNKQEFTDAIIVSTARITSRILIYWVIILFAIPVLVRRTLTLVLPLVHPRDQSRPVIRHALLTFEWLMRHFVTLACFSVLVPQLFSQIDRYSSRLVKQRKTPKSLWEFYFGKITEDLMSNGQQANETEEKENGDKTKQ